MLFLTESLKVLLSSKELVKLKIWNNIKFFKRYALQFLNTEINFSLNLGIAYLFWHSSEKLLKKNRYEMLTLTEYLYINRLSIDCRFLKNNSRKINE